MSEEKIKISSNNNSYTIDKRAVAQIDPKLCINCGKCRRSCPVEAIKELQRLICRQCPDCADSEVMFHYQAGEYAHEHACSIACPLGTVPEGYVNLIAEGRFEDAYDLISELNPLPSVCSRICNHPCEDECKRGLLIDKPISIRGLKRFVLDNVKVKRTKFIQKYDIKIAIAGAGPAGITAAYDLAKKGYKVKIFESSASPGGMMDKCIPSFRLNKNVLEDEIQSLLDAGIEIEYNARVGVKPTIDELFKDNYTAVLISVGAVKGSKLPIENNNAEMVYDAVSFMQKAESGIPVEVGKKAVVIGAGSVAVDTARTLLRLGVKDVTCACVEDYETMPAPKREIDDAEDEGIKFMPSVAPVKINAEWITVKGVQFKRVSGINCDDSGRLNINTIDKSEFDIEADTVIFATGQKIDSNEINNKMKLKIAENRRVYYDKKTMMTNIDRVYAAGDVITPRGSVIDAMASGRKAALSIDNMIMRRYLKDRTKHNLETAPVKEMIYPVRLEKLYPQKMRKSEKINFEDAELGFTEKQAILEAKRCMKCGYEMVDKDKCIGCGVCQSICPNNAITMVSPEKEGK